MRSRGMALFVLGWVSVVGSLGACSTNAPTATNAKNATNAAQSSDHRSTGSAPTVSIASEISDSSVTLPRSPARDQAVPTVVSAVPSPSSSFESVTSQMPVASNVSQSTSSGVESTAPSAGLVLGSAAGRKLAAAARAQVGVTTGYDPAYVGLSFPGGDVDAKTGVCSDVVVRALRELGIDMQERVNRDMKAHFAEYPTKWGLSSPDPNIDHRRVPNLATYFARKGYERPVTGDPANYQPGDIVWIKLPLDHTGIVSDRTIDGRPLLIHNVGRGAQEEDVLFSWTIVGHYRVLD